MITTELELKEYEIKELEWKLSKLKNETRKQKALEHIKKTVDDKNNADKKTIEDLKYQYEELFKKISALIPRVEDILDIAKTLYENKMYNFWNTIHTGSKFNFGNHYCYDCQHYSGIKINLDKYHEHIYVGYYNREKDSQIKIITYWGQMKPNEDKYTAKDIIEGLTSTIAVMNYFIDNFSKFEDSVYEFVDKL